MSGEVTRRKVKDAGKSIQNEVEKSNEPVVPVADGSPSKRRSDKDKGKPGDPPPKFGPMPRFSKQRLWSRGILVTGLLVIVWWNSGKRNEQSFASFDEDINAKAMKTRCSANFESAARPYPKCTPKQCGRIVVDNLFASEEIYLLKDLMKRVFQEAKGEGAATVFDFHLGRLQFEGEAVDLYNLNATRPIFEKTDQLIYQSMKQKLQRMVSSYFAIEHWSLHTAAPFFMTRLTRKFAKTQSDEYWHTSVHQKQFKTYHYSTVLFMSDYGDDLEGGRLIFIDGDNTNRTVDPKIGRAIAFTAGDESVHYTERVRQGMRYAITMGFTCNPEDSTLDPKL